MRWSWESEKKYQEKRPNGSGWFFLFGLWGIRFRFLVQDGCSEMQATRKMCSLRKSHPGRMAVSRDRVRISELNRRCSVEAGMDSGKLWVSNSNSLGEDRWVTLKQSLGAFSVRFRVALTEMSFLSEVLFRFSMTPSVCSAVGTCGVFGLVPSSCRRL